MAPMEHVEIRQGSLGDMRRGAEAESIRRRRGSKNTPFKANKRGGEGSGGGVDSNPSDGGGGEGKPNNDGGKKTNGSSPTDNSNNKNNDPPPMPTRTPPTSYFPVPAPLTVAAASPTTIWVISTTTATTAPSTSYTSSISSSTISDYLSGSNIATSNTSQTSVTTPVPKTTSSSISTPTATVYTSLPTSAPPRKGLNTDGDDPPSATSSSYFSTPSSIVISTTVIPASSLTAATALALPDTAANSKNNHHPKGDEKNGDLSPLAEHLLIAAGAMGAFIIVAAAIWLFARMWKIDLLSPTCNRKIERGGLRGRYGWRKQPADYTSDPPPQYSGQEFPVNEKTFFNQQSVDAYYTPLALPPLAIPSQSATALARVNSQRQELVREALVRNAAPFGMSTFHKAAAPVEQTFYNPDDQNSSSLTRQGTQTTQVSAAHSGYRNAGTQNTIQTSGAYDPNQREVNHLSYLSSLSSGFGDGLIIPEPTVVGAGDPRQSYRSTRKFSWMTSNAGSRGPVGDRDTVYTNASIESAPRFRTINSWVAQQSDRVGRQVQSGQEVPSMPVIPLPLQGSTGIVHQRNISEDPAFRHHPGDEIKIGRGSRVPSSILDKKFTVNLG